MRDKIIRFLRAHTSPGDRLLAAVSGGRDSMSMLHVLCSLPENLGLTVSAAHFHHGLRGDEADRDEDFVRRWCSEVGIPFYSGRGDAAAFAETEGLSLEDAARRLRYDYLLSLDPKAKVLTAHTAEDNLETVLLHLIRGAGLHGLTGIPPENGRILRPMLDVTRQERDDYLEANGIPFVEDSTNESSRYLRNRVRQQILPLLQAENPSLGESVTALTRTLRQEDDYLNALAGEALSSIICPDGLDRAGLLALPEALQPRVLMTFLAPVPDVSRAHLEAGLALCRGSSTSGSLDLSGPYRLQRVYDRILLIGSEAAEAIPSPVGIVPGQTVLFGSWVVTCQRAPKPETLPDGTLALDAACVAGPLTLRPRSPGDVIRLPGGTKKISRLMVDRKVPVYERNAMPVLWHGDTVAAVLPLAASRQYMCKQIGRDSLLLSAKRTED